MEEPALYKSPLRGQCICTGVEVYVECRLSHVEYGLHMQCFVYRSPRKADTFLYLAEKDGLSELPSALLEVFGAPQFSFDFELTPERKLVREDAVEVIENLKARGFHLQMSAEHEEPI